MGKVKTDKELIELLAIQVEALSNITEPTDMLDCLAQMTGTGAKLSRSIVIKMVMDVESSIEENSNDVITSN